MAFPLLIAIFLVAAVAALPSSDLPNITDPSAFVNQTYLLVTNTPNVIGNYSITMLNGPVHPGNETTASHVVAEIIYNKSYDQIGWDFVQVTANQDLLNSEEDKGFTAYYAAGYLEGYVTAVKIGQVFVGNNLTYPQPPAVADWVDRHIAFMKSQATDNMRAGYPSAFWTQLGNLVAQMEGIAAGYMQYVVDHHRVGAENQPNLTFTEIFLLNFNNELGDIFNVVNVSSFESEVFAPKQRTAVSAKHDNKLMPFKNKNLHCSALVKVTSNDIFFSHVTWGGYNTMVRQYKVYKFQTTVSMSAVAGTIASGDDWYQTSNMLGVQETTNDYYNNSLFQFVIPESSSEFLRVMVATFLANNGREWVELFQFNNSGTYCNQWMVLDYKLYTPGAVGDALPDNLLWVAEQIPGNVTSADVTFVLRATTYWASFNIPYFPNIYNLSGFAALEEEFGPVNSYTKYARPEIFKRNNTDVVDLESMRRMMRYNNWEFDPLSVIPMRRMMRYNNWEFDPLSVIPLCPECNPKGSPWLTISSRGDLVDSSFILPANKDYGSQFEQAPMGGIDNKIGSYEMISKGAMGTVICGPTYDQQPVFNFSKVFPDLRPPGSANYFDFPYVFFNVVGQPPQGTGSDNNDTRNVIIGVCVGVPVALIAVSFVVYRYRKNADEDGTYAPVNQGNNLV
ncbi:lysosomal endosomal membrane protein p68, putative [Bodo saltans]|uniref:Phospholipase B-like n=1 Tax=Bodo saltans TaxID=75058 RepID=A0A0S4IX51_BODSA|nr:lysosomal endosomal membrane protein p68, putative [Bodo saltans]|eukprot:CUG06600.1 lysosomal endosomal membrane protein p68, putative [Bodo saltans]